MAYDEKLIFYQGNFPAQVYTRSNMEEKIKRYIRELYRMGCGYKDRILVQLENSPEAIAVYEALRRSGMIAVPVNPRDTRASVEAIASHAGARYLIDGLHISSLYVPFPEFDPLVDLDRVTTIMYTSGTTGTPKGVCLGLSQWLSNAASLVAHHGLTSQTIVASPLPLFHCNAHGFAMFAVQQAHAKLVLFNKLLPNFLDILNEEQVSIASVVPAMLGKLFEANPTWKPHKGFKYFVSAAAPLPRFLALNIYEHWGARVVQGYGLSESTNFSCTLPVDLDEETYKKVMGLYHPDDFPSIGVALPGVEVMLMNNQELFVKSESNFVGYWRESVQKYEWVATGDLADYKEINGQRFYFITGRRKEMINRGGDKIAPVGLEELMREMGWSGDFVIVSIPDEKLGEEVGLVTTFPVDEKMIERLPWHLRPKKWVMVSSDEIPRTSTGKIQRAKASLLIS